MSNIQTVGSYVEPEDQPIKALYGRRRYSPVWANENKENKRY
jgi:hypothetical protein